YSGGAILSREKRATAKHSFDRRTQITCHIGLQNVTARAYALQGVYKSARVVHAEYHDAGRQIELEDLPRSLETIHHRHGNVQDGWSRGCAADPQAQSAYPHRGTQHARLARSYRRPEEHRRARLRSEVQCGT